MGLPFPSPEDLPNSGIIFPTQGSNPLPLRPACIGQVGSLSLAPPGKPPSGSLEKSSESHSVVSDSLQQSMGFCRPQYWSGLPRPFPGGLSDPVSKPRSPALQADSLSSEQPGSLQACTNAKQNTTTSDEGNPSFHHAGQLDCVELGVPTWTQNEALGPHFPLAHPGETLQAWPAGAPCPHAGVAQPCSPGALSAVAAENLPVSPLVSSARALSPSPHVLF